MKSTFWVIPLVGSPWPGAVVAPGHPRARDDPPRDGGSQGRPGTAAAGGSAGDIWNRRQLSWGGVGQLVL